MAINKKLIHFNNFSNFNSKKLSANVENTKYTIGIEGSILNGEPEILYQSIVYIKDVLQLWTHGLIYDCSEAGFIPGEGEGSAILNGATDCSATGKNSIAGGRLAHATGECSIALGRGCEASGKGSVAIGGHIGVIKLTGPANSLVYTTSNYMPADLIGLSLYLDDSVYTTKIATITNIEGNTITLDNTLSVDSALKDTEFIIHKCKATEFGAITLGMSSEAKGLSSLAEGYGTIASGHYSHAEGLFTIASGFASHAEGRTSRAMGLGSHSEGMSIAKGYLSHSEGGGNLNIYLTGNNKIYTVNKGMNFQNSFFLTQSILNLNLLDAETSNVLAKIINVYIEEDGYTITIELDTDLGELQQKYFIIPSSVAEEMISHSENLGYAYGYNSHAGGWGTAKNEYSFSHGDQSVASGKTSTVFGTNNYSQNNSEFSLGRSNRSHNGETDADKTLFSVGCGLFSEISMETRIANKIPLPTPEDGTNALEIMQNGDVWLGTYNEGHKIWDNVNKKVCNAWSILEEDPFNGHEYVDLGLPSGTLWATSVIKNKLGEPLYFAWGDTEGWTAEQINNGEKAFAWDGSDYKWNEGEMACDGSSMTKYNATDGKTVLDLEDDAAHVHMGGDWHMPTKEQWEELTANTTSAWTTKNGVNGRLFTSTINGKSVFVPAFGDAGDGGLYGVGSVGDVWSSSVDEGSLNAAWYLYFNSSGVSMSSYGLRTYGHCVLGVIKPKS